MPIVNFCIIYNSWDKIRRMKLDMKIVKMFQIQQCITYVLLASQYHIILYHILYYQELNYYSLLHKHWSYHLSWLIIIIILIIYYNNRNSYEQHNFTNLMIYLLVSINVT